MFIWENTSYSEVTQFQFVIFSAENVLAFDVTMQNIFAMTVLDGRTNLCEIVKKLILFEVLLLAISINCLTAIHDLAL